MFETIHTEATAFLARDPFLLQSQVEVIPEDKGDILTAITLAVAKLGIVAVVSTPSAKATSSNARNITAMASVEVQVYENPVINRRRANICAAGTAARHIAAALNLEKLPGGDTIVFKEITSGALDKATLVFSVSFEALTTLEKENKK